MKFNFEKRNLAEIAKEVAGELKALAEQRGLKIELKISKNIPLASLDYDTIRCYSLREPALRTRDIRIDSRSKKIKRAYKKILSV